MELIWLFFFVESSWSFAFFFFFQAEDGIRDVAVTGVQTCALPIWTSVRRQPRGSTKKSRDTAKSFLAERKTPITPPVTERKSSCSDHPDASHRAPAPRRWHKRTANNHRNRCAQPSHRDQGWNRCQRRFPRTIQAGHAAATCPHRQSPTVLTLPHRSSA